MTRLVSLKDAERAHKRATQAVDPSANSAEEAPPFSDEALALRFAAEHLDRLRYTAQESRWRQWNGTHWAADDTLHVFDLARRGNRAAAAECNKPNTAVALASVKTVNAVERLARFDRRLVAIADQWDADPYLLNTPDGVIDLRTGKVRSHSPHDYMTKIAAVGPRGDCPRWLAFLDRIFGGDGDLIAYLQRVLGYGLTGLTIEHALFFAFGTGANGKSVLLATIAGIAGDYHRTAPIEAFVASNGDRHPTELAGLRGARLVTATETEEGRRWAESRIKQLTGGDTIAARFMRQDFFEYRPAFKLVIAGNHKPSLRTINEAIRRRFHLIPFAVTIPPDERDGELTEKLKTEWPGILAWLIEGALKWRTEGLRPPPAVVEATDAYLVAEDALAAWMDERCERDPAAWASSTELFGSWSGWANASGEYPGTMRSFAQALESRGLTPARMRHGRGFRGLRVIQDDGLLSERTDA